MPVVDGGMNVDGFEAHGGWIASAADLIRFAGSFDRPEGPSLLSRETVATMFERPAGDSNAVWYGCGWRIRTAGPGGEGKEYLARRIVNTGNEFAAGAALGWVDVGGAVQHRFESERQDPRVPYRRATACGG